VNPRCCSTFTRGLARGLVILTTLATAVAADPPPKPGDLVLDARRIVVLGDSITHDGRWVADLDAWMEAHGLTAEVLDMALPSVSTGCSASRGPIS
jgi:hypothetical protein